MPEKSAARVHDCDILELDRHHSRRKGDLSVVSGGHTVPFDVRRVYYLYDVPGGESRGGHAHRRLQQLIIAAAGSFTVTLDDGHLKRRFTLNRPYHALLVRPGIWRTIDDFSSGAVCLVLASDHYDEAEYLRRYSDFLSFRKEIEK
ncbi:MAG: FdtA/QdtA family cupin domain-containing protein [Muribaculaceae bacterium]|nr:FdtA/QdtA family cupin domain-containing protein [Muribaculaceae bacterium]MDE6540574.1 FdtA/QdtA family cupin domain-containing protein [Muribaculaceae bacterium]